MAVSGIDTTTSVDTWADVDNQESWDQSVDPSLWNVQMQLRSTNDNPASSPTWSGWMPFVIGDYSARAFQFQALLSSDLAGVTPAITQLQVDLTMPDRTDSDNNITTLAGGSAITFDNPFRATPAISITAQNMATGIITPSPALRLPASPSSSLTQATPVYPAPSTTSPKVTARLFNLTPKGEKT